MIKTVILNGTVSASSAETKIAEDYVPAKKKWRILELRFYTDASSDVDMYLYARTTQLYHAKAEILNLYKLPLPGNVDLDESTPVILNAANSDTSNHTVMVELVVDETS